MNARLILNLVQQVILLVKEVAGPEQIADLDGPVDLPQAGPEIDRTVDQGAGGYELRGGLAGAAELPQEQQEHDYDHGHHDRRRVSADGDPPQPAGRPEKSLQSVHARCSLESFAR